MTDDPCVDDAAWQRIGSQLEAVERDHGVRIVLAVESGSRAWRFPSVDSDYDVRFVYVRPPEGYLSVERHRDVIELPTDGVWDINGWDIRKVLYLATRSNAAVLEWLQSPVRYREVEAAQRILAFARAICNLPALSYHYDRMARTSFSIIESTEGEVRMKTYCYALRPVLALYWIRGHVGPPPMDLPGLLQGLEIEASVRAAISDLVDRKARQPEVGTTPHIPLLDDFIRDSLALSENVPRPRVPGGELIAQANTLFSSLVLEQGTGDVYR